MAFFWPPSTQAFSTAGLTAFAIVTAVCLVRRYFNNVVATYRYRTKVDSDGIPYFVGTPFFGCRDWASSRSQFVEDCLSLVRKNIIKIKAPNKITVTVLSGPKAASVFFNQKGLSLDRGYMMMQHENADWRDVDSMPATASGIDMAAFHSCFRVVFGLEKLKRRSRSVLHNIEEFCKPLGRSGTVDLFHTQRDLVLQLLLRTIFPNEIADDKRVIGYVDKLYEAIESPGTSWLPAHNRLRKYFYGYKLYTALDTHLKQDQRSEEYTDTINLLLERGDGVKGIISFAVGATYAGLSNTARLLPWIMVHLTVYPEWRAKVLREMQDMLDKHGATAETLDRIPFDAWETSLPSLDMVADETLRTQGRSVLLRQNIGEAFEVDGHTIPKGACLAYPTSDAHDNPLFYGSSPQVFNPGCVERASNDKQINFVGWGSGRHRCTGRYVARLIYRQVVTYFLTRFDCEIVDSSGHPLQTVPRVDLNSVHFPLPVNMPMMRYRVRGA